LPNTPWHTHSGPISSRSPPQKPPSMHLQPRYTMPSTRISQYYMTAAAGLPKHLTPKGSPTKDELAGATVTVDHVQAGQRVSQSASPVDYAPAARRFCHGLPKAAACLTYAVFHRRTTTSSCNA